MLYSKILLGTYAKTLLIICSGIFFLVMFSPLLCASCLTENSEYTVGMMRTAFLLFCSLIVLYLVRQNRILFVLVALTVVIVEYSHYYSRLNWHFAPDYNYQQYFSQNSLLPELSTTEELFRFNNDGNQFTYNNAYIRQFLYSGYESMATDRWFKSQEKMGIFKHMQYANVKYVTTTQPNWQEGNPEVEKLSLVRSRTTKDEVILGVAADGFSSQTPTDYYVYRLNNYLPRFFVPRQVSYCGNNCDYANPLEIAYVESQGDDYVNPAADKVTMVVESYRANSIRLRVETPAKTFIGSSEIWDPGWSVIVNGKSERITPIAGAFRGVYVPEGNSFIEYSYFPVYLREGIAISVLTAIGASVVVMMYWRNPVFRNKLDYYLS